MYLSSNKFYLIFISIWIIGLYYFFSSSHGPTPNEKYAEERITYLQKEIESLREKIQQTQSRNQQNELGGNRLVLFITKASSHTCTKHLI